MAPRSDEAKAWFVAVYSAVSEIPQGRVTSYGHIALLLGYPQRARQVGVCLKHLPEDTTLRFHAGTVPWQRVINSKGAISPRGPGGAARQALALRREGVRVEQGPMGEYVIDLEQFGWFPRYLPSDDAPSDESESEENDGTNDNEAE